MFFCRAKINSHKVCKISHSELSTLLAYYYSQHVASNKEQSKISSFQVTQFGWEVKMGKLANRLPRQILNRTRSYCHAKVGHYEAVAKSLNRRSHFKGSKLVNRRNQPQIRKLARRDPHWRLERVRNVGKINAMEIHV